jgi:hypothetical protein
MKSTIISFGFVSKSERGERFDGFKKSASEISMAALR